MPDHEDPDSFTNKKGKDYFIDFSKKNKISIHQFIFEHYKKETDNNPSSMAIFEKKLREKLKDRVPKNSIFNPPYSTLSVGGIFGGIAHNVISDKGMVAMCQTDRKIGGRVLSKHSTVIIITERCYIYYVVLFFR